MRITEIVNIYASGSLFDKKKIKHFQGATK